MAFQVVSLLTALLVTSAWGQFPMLGGFPGMNPYRSGFQNQQQQQQVDPNLLTCINADGQDLQSQIRLTIRPLNAQSMGLNPMGLGFGSMGPGGPMNQDHEQEWTVDGLLLPSQLVQKAGSYRVAIFSGGRTFGQCKMSGLGQVLDTGSQNPMMSAMRMGPGSPFGMGLGMNPFGNMFGNRFQQEPNGLVSNSALVSTGTTMYSGIVRGISYNQMVGRSIGVCQSVQGGQCYGLIPYCCSITRDALPASEVYVDPLAGAQQAGPFAFNQAGVVGVQGGVPGARLPRTGAGVTTVIGGDDGFF
ncbi:hypothetical protein ACOMHN_018727 [Nucella lapillus]